MIPFKNIPNCDIAGEPDGTFTKVISLEALKKNFACDPDDDTQILPTVAASTLLTEGEDGETGSVTSTQRLTFVEGDVANPEVAGNVVTIPDHFIDFQSEGVGGGLPTGNLGVGTYHATPTPVFTVTNPSTTRNMLLQIIVEDSLSWVARSNSAMARLQGEWNVDGAGYVLHSNEGNIQKPLNLRAAFAKTKPEELILAPSQSVTLQFRTCLAVAAGQVEVEASTTRAHLIYQVI